MRKIGLMTFPLFESPSACSISSIVMGEQAIERKPRVLRFPYPPTSWSIAQIECLASSVQLPGGAKQCAIVGWLRGNGNVWTDNSWDDGTPIPEPDTSPYQ